MSYASINLHLTFTEIINPKNLIKSSDASIDIHKWTSMS